MRFSGVAAAGQALRHMLSRLRRLLSKLRRLYKSATVRRRREDGLKMDFFDVVGVRQSIRAFAERPVEEEKLRKVLETANQAPSAGNLQAYEIFVVRRASDRKALARASHGQEFVAGAPLVLVFCARPGRAAPKYGQRGIRLFATQDATIACTFAMLGATALGLATVWVGAFLDDDVRHAIRGSEEVFPVAILPIGYAAENPMPTGRRGIADLAHEL